MGDNEHYNCDIENSENKIQEINTVYAYPKGSFVSYEPSYIEAYSLEEHIFIRALIRFIKNGCKG